jgi:hypothetical protein
VRHPRKSATPAWDGLAVQSGEEGVVQWPGRDAGGRPPRPPRRTNNFAAVF